MKKIFLLLICFLLFAAANVFAQNKPHSHIIKKGETAFKIAKQYGLTVTELQKANPTVTLGALKEGASLNIPVAATAPSGKQAVQVKLDKEPKNSQQDPLKNNPAATNIDATTQPVKDNKITVVAEQIKPVKHLVKANETLYLLARAYKTTAEAIAKWNNIKLDTPLSANTQLIVGWLYPGGENANPNDTVVIISKPNVADRLKKEYEAQTGKSKTDGGFVLVFDDNNASKEGETNYYVLHRSAPINSVIKIYNPVNKKSIYAKVSAKLPPTAENKEVVVKIPTSAAKKLNIDKPTRISTIYKE
ncbi:MAG: LysM peptidoglycan-binding domain-containing protein [Chitinophagales bacterium]|jgi:LysM repeat protein|nr:LysM peptidoglycan-binding domain-containing protein [Sphingobacteriales bacterium]MBP9141761.1 LysM peptidoglycan-binding domain-containing protein [Chitinophagales bacterium]MDA0197224.1 LysM peptidoglycan-binding domain-containing protein [Bacteroidota bacterium]MBK8677182.1 LysM peptidoglycan-binding domain-containing protein [Sphingobacteriales bacterium]MBL0248244.1 LysM peptidoglycan-binding domain-containing protein [Sphingobacteriales bacterium]